MEKAKKSERIIGLDILKIISAIMVVILHYCGYSGNLMIGTAQTSGLFFASNFIEAFSICAVNVFVIITCYINVTSGKTDLKEGVGKAVHLWVQTIVITVPIAIILLAFGISELNSGIISSVFPFSAKAYWFITTFICFNLFLPLLNRSVAALSDRSLRYLAAVLVLICSVIPTFFEIFGWNEVQNGYSLIWFVTLYYCTAALLRLDFLKKIPTWLHACIYFFSSLIIFFSVVLLEKIGGGGYTCRE